MADESPHEGVNHQPIGTSKAPESATSSSAVNWRMRLPSTCRSAPHRPMSRNGSAGTRRRPNRVVDRRRASDRTVPVRERHHRRDTSLRQTRRGLANPTTPRRRPPRNRPARTLTRDAFIGGTNRRSASRAAPLPPAPLTPPNAPCNEATKPLRAADIVFSVFEAETLRFGAHLVEGGAALGKRTLRTSATVRSLRRCVVRFRRGVSRHPSSLQPPEIAIHRISGQTSSGPVRWVTAVQQGLNRPDSGRRYAYVFSGLVVRESGGRPNGYVCGYVPPAVSTSCPRCRECRSPPLVSLGERRRDYAAGRWSSMVGVSPSVSAMR